KLSIFQANLRWVLKHDVACVVHSGVGTDDDKTDEAILATGHRLTRSDEELLHHYAAALSPHYCRGCDDICGEACPENISIAAVQQFAMYHDQYGWTERAKKHYRALPMEARWADRCASCDECSNACPYGVEAAAQIRHAKATLDVVRALS
ncbi:4Fe-4S dicluster domain-containing protein, partial [Desulfobulbus sp. AH-315-M07]|nr:4Fe-4S dicluster domain-containing protein [Desulfobulbus sp. AH-315-M07]